MAQIIAWKCAYTGKIFEDKTKYNKHVRKIAKQRVMQRKIDNIKKERKDFFTNMRTTVRTPNELVDFVKANWEKFCDNALVNDTINREHRIKKNLSHPKLTLLSFEARWSDCVSNSHSCPRTGVRNWNRKGVMDDGSPIPTGYPGWLGNIKYQTSETDTSWYEFGSPLWKETGIHTGTGGYGAGYYYSVDMFADDWPAMADLYEKARTWKIMSNDSRSIDVIAEAMLDEEK